MLINYQSIFFGFIISLNKIILVSGNYIKELKLNIRLLLIFKPLNSLDLRQ